MLAEVLWKEIAIIFITPTVVWLQVTQQGGNTSTENWIKGLLRVPWWLGGRPRFDPWVGKIRWRRKWQPTPVLLPRKFHGWRSLVSYSPQGHKESDMTERLYFHLSTAPPTRTRPSFPQSQSFPSGSFHKPLILIHQRADRLKTSITENQPI